jgi:hypothetical protein
MSRRSNGEGTIGQLADGRWRARVRVPDGRRVAVYGKSRAECARALLELRHALGSGATRLPNRARRRS